ncbi:alpha/beta fold hydrolase [Arthrospira platensis]|uniref:AB hydrolase-1 domain-containing protein n=1 Tax=Limnospira platensis NIES-46 TaxID=1236695 RepID=A0A5M3T8G6_LIMPL|nr:alpha/beta fold hydrolase [Arthrospira platensis]AMW30184.1 alpha/beta hydrolase [Arthrospira platensis YZ]KDR54136.1 alpha/beta hydrolase [Arthrospira platensis str. Paraca]MBD2670491.1 alpha/beta fold hydrolase [Arthrospira platensis FACHB-439]MBD2711781.1 alpha/beta fold hydrolase [Arthrospira platensis FACHB-835]MDT9183608.1 alpha/beta fold hydrolase [Limnospira sp. PMC 289.06]MDT9311506.1 alpha/beta fold hydrolase [Limnospira sp. Paracas R14]QQW28147.1 alpha/beta fold hydrolase [Arth
MTATQPSVNVPSCLESLDWTWKNHSIRYTVQGTGQPLILVHGFGASIGHWRQNIPVLAAGGYRVFALDLLGFGASGKPAVDYTLDLWEELLRDFWSEQVGEPAVFVGNSIGALLSLMVAVNYPDICRGAVLLNCAGGLNHRPEELNFPLRVVMGTFTKLVASPAIGPLVFNQVRQKHRIRNTLRQVYGNREAITDELVDLLYEPSNDVGAQQVFASILSAPPGSRPSELLPKLQRPLLVIWGENDPWTPIKGADIYRDLATTGASVEFVSIPETGHCPHDERPTVVNPLILNWLDNLGGSL